MLVSLTPAADTGHVSRELVRRGLWVKRLESASGVHFVVGAHSARVDRTDLVGIAGVADVASTKSPSTKTLPAGSMPTARPYSSVRVLVSGVRNWTGR